MNTLTRLTFLVFFSAARCAGALAAEHFWTEAEHHRIRRSNLDGSGAETIVELGIDLDLDGDEGANDLSLAVSVQRPRCRAATRAERS